MFLGKHVMVMNGHPARSVMWLENPCFGDADPRGGERYFSLTKKVYAALSETISTRLFGGTVLCLSGRL